MGDLISLVVVIGILYFAFLILKAIVVGLTAPFRSSKPEKYDDDDSYGISVSVSYSDNYSTSRKKHSTKAINQQAANTWVSPRQSVNVKGYVIDSGMLYVGKKLPTITDWHTEPALINPSLSIKKTACTDAGDDMGYWPSYSEIPAKCRGAYLDWLSTGRNNPQAYIGYVFLFIYGLERRAVVDTRHLPEAAQDLPAIREEVRRLYEIYAPINRSFQRYVSEFLDFLAMKVDGIKTENVPAIDSVQGIFPLQLKTSLGARVNTGLPITAEWAYAWFLCDSDLPKLIAAKRCPDDFKNLFIVRFKEKYPDGFSLKPNKSTLRYDYHAASSGVPTFEDDVMYQGKPLPDVTILKRPKTIIGGIADQCHTELDAYARFLGRKSTENNQALGLGLLPPELLHITENSEITKLRQTIETSLGDSAWSEIPGLALYANWPTTNPDKMTKKENVSLVQLLGSLGWGIEPDPRFGRSGLTPATRAIVFPLPQTAPVAPSKEYTAACTLLHLAALVSAADGTVSEDEEAHLEQHLESQLGLYPEERVRLNAHMRYILANPPTVAGLKRRVEHVTTRQKETIARFLIDVALADGVVDANEVKVLEKIYKAMSLDHQGLYSQIHAVSTNASPAPSAATTSKPELDEALLAKKLKETEEVASILTGILGEEEEAVVSVPQTVEAGGQSVAGLDTNHSGFLQALGDQVQWTRDELESLAERFNLMIDGALELVNESAYDHCDAPVIEEEDDELYILDSAIHKEMFSEQRA
jgi:tellurite resistance protein